MYTPTVTTSGRCLVRTRGSPTPMGSLGHGGGPEDRSETMVIFVIVIKTLRFMFPCYFDTNVVSR